MVVPIDEIKQKVSERYSSFAERMLSGAQPSAGCCGTSSACCGDAASESDFVLLFCSI